jgi:folate-binding protein YgfZ
VDLVMPSELRENAWSSLSKAFTPLDDQLSETLRIEAGVPRWGAELDENTLPNEAGLDRDAIDYHKGCYVGQEVISRIKSVGHVNRSLRGFVSDSPLAAGMQLFESNEAAEKSVGHLTSAVWSFGLEKWAALGYLKRGIESPALEARAADGTAAEVAVKDLPLIPF